MSVESFETTVRVRYYEADQMGIVHHSQYIKYFELARIEWLRHLNISYRQMESLGALLVVAKVDCRYRSPARFDDVLTVAVTLDKLTKMRVELAYRIDRPEDGAFICEGHTTLCCIDTSGNLSVLPPALAELIQG